MDMADYMDIGTPVSSPLENTIEAAGTLAQYYVSQGSTLGAYAYNTQGGGELLSPDSGQKTVPPAHTDVHRPNTRSA